jgi:hypothetical protein
MNFTSASLHGIIFPSTLALESALTKVSIIQSKSISHLTFQASIKAHIFSHVDSIFASVTALILSLSPGFSLQSFSLDCISGDIFFVICLVSIFVGFINCSIA